jgi:hypothetical protein
MLIQRTVVFMFLIALASSVGARTSRELEFSISGSTLSVRVPDTSSADIPDLDRLRSFDVSTLGAGDSPARFKTLYQNLWDFDRSFLSGVSGRLGFQIVLINHPADDGDLRCEARLWATELSNLEKWNKSIDESFRGGERLEIPDHYETISSPGGKWIYYAEGRRSHLVAAVSRHVTLALLFEYADNSRGERLGRWLPKAKAVEKAIVESIRVVGLPIDVSESLDCR